MAAAAAAAAAEAAAAVVAAAELEPAVNGTFPVECARGRACPSTK